MNPLLASLPHNADLLDALLTVAKEHDVAGGWVVGIGALSAARVAFYDQTTKEYIPIELPGEWEILSLSGNLSPKDGELFPHIHLILSDRNGNTKGGHALPGCRIFVTEIAITPTSNPPHRTLDPHRSLPLWP